MAMKDKMATHEVAETDEIARRATVRRRYIVNFCVKEVQRGSSGFGSLYNSKNAARSPKSETRNILGSVRVSFNQSFLDSLLESFLEILKRGRNDVKTPPEEFLRRF
jgi:hypothetical protein